MTLPLLLYLRPFTSDGKVTVANPEKSSIWRNLMPTSSSGTEANITLEELILQSSAGIGLLIAIGKTVEIVGAGKVIAGDSEWQEYFMALSLKAGCILSVPSMHPSTTWEIEWLARNKLFHRVVFVFTDLHFSGNDIANFDKDVIGRHLRTSGWAIPNDLTSSTLLSFTPEGSVESVVHDSRHKKGHVRAQIQQVIARQ